MKIALKDNEKFVLRFDKGEEVIAGIASFMKEHGVYACFFSAIGSAAEVELGYYNSFLKEYRHKPFVENLEVISLNGNGATNGDQPVLHAHGLLGRTDFSTFGGHVFRLVVLATCEVTLTVMQGRLERSKNENFNLNLLA